MFGGEFWLKHYNFYKICLKNYHTSLKRTSQKNYVVPKQFLSLAEKTMVPLGKRGGKNSSKKRLDKERVSKKEYLYGISPCLAALQVNRRRFYTVYFSDETSQSTSRHELQQIKTLATHRKIPTKSVSRKRLDDLCGNRLHQNIVMKVDNLPLIPLKESHDSVLDANMRSEARPMLWLILQGIQDPMNMGAILRTAVFLGVDKIVSSDFDSCPLTPVVSKASAGAMESVAVYTYDIKRLLERKRKENYEILGTVGPHVVPPGRITPENVNDFKLTKPSLLVLGNEGKGLSIEIQNLCTKFLTISSQKDKLMELDSLNVSVAAGIILHSLVSNIE